jgi:hypothetical protein
LVNYSISISPSLGSQYPKLAGTKKMRKLAQRLFCGHGNGQNPAGEEPMAMVSREQQQQQNRPQILVEY